MQLPFTTLVNETILVVEAALHAGKEILQVYATDFSTTLKGEDDPLTQADLRSNAVLQDHLKKSGYLVLSEESADNPRRLAEKRIWVVDPLDGTKEFINRNGEFSIMIGLVEDRKPILGLIYQPTTGSLYLAQKGQGAYRKEGSGWKRLHVGSVSQLQLARAVMSRSRLSDDDKNFLSFAQVTQLLQRGSGLKIGDISEDHADFYLNSSNKLKQWDTCAPSLILAEAGGKMTDLSGSELLYNVEVLNHEHGVLASNGILHQQLVAAYKKFIEQ